MLGKIGSDRFCCGLAVCDVGVQADNIAGLVCCLCNIKIACAGCAVIFQCVDRVLPLAVFRHEIRNAVSGRGNCLVVLRVRGLIFRVCRLQDPVSGIGRCAGTFSLRAVIDDRDTGVGRRERGESHRSHQNAGKSCRQAFFKSLHSFLLLLCEIIGLTKFFFNYDGLDFAFSRKAQIFAVTLFLRMCVAAVSR